MGRPLPVALLACLLLPALVPLLPVAEAATVERMGEMPEKLIGAAAARVGGTSYIFGGRLPNGLYSDRVHAYDHATGTSSIVARFPPVGTEPGGRYSGAAAAVGTKIYYFGGAVLMKIDVSTPPDGQPETVPQAVRDVFEFDTTTRQLTQLQVNDRLPRAAWGMAAQAFGDKIYVFGGFSLDWFNPTDFRRLDTILRFDAAATAGTRLSQAPIARIPFAVQDMAAASMGSRIYLFGGAADDDPDAPCPPGPEYNETTQQYERLKICKSDVILAYNPSNEASAPFEVGRMPFRAQFVSGASARVNNQPRAYVVGGQLSDGSAASTVLEASLDTAGAFTVRALPPALPTGAFGAAVTSDGTTLSVFGGRTGKGLSEATANVVRITPGVTPPAAPRNVVVTPSSGAVRIAWEAPSYDGESAVTGYRVYRTGPEGNETLLGEVTTLLYDDKTARAGTDYTYRVTALNAAGESLTSTVGTISSGATTAPPGPVPELQGFAGNRQAVLRWAPPAELGGLNLSGYRIYRDGATVPIVVPPSKLEHVDTGLVNGQLYTYVVRAFNAKGEGPPSPRIDVAPADLPAPPAAVSALPDPAGVALSWDAGASVTRYQVLRGLSPGNLQPVGESTQSSFTDASATRGRTYYYAIASINQAGRGPPSPPVSVALVTKPGPPENLFAAPEEGAIRLTWRAPANTGDAPLDQLRYYVSRARPGGNPTILYTDLAGTAYLDRTALPGQTYEYSVTTLNPLASDPSASVRGTPKAVVNKLPVAALAVLPAVGRIGDVMAFDGTPSRDEDGHVQQYRFDFGDGSEPLVSTSGTATHAYATNGTFVARLVVVDNRLAESTAANVTVIIGAIRDIPTGGDFEIPRPATPTVAAPGTETPGIPGLPLAGLVAALAVAAVAAKRRR